MELVQVVRRNLNALLDAARDEVIQGPASVLALEAVSGVGKSTIYRILDAEADNKLTVRTLEQIAEPYGLQAWQLLVPGLWLDPSRPAKLLDATEQEQYEIMKIVFQHAERVAGRGRGNNNVARGTPGPGDNDTGTGPDSSSKPPHKRPKAPRP